MKLLEGLAAFSGVALAACGSDATDYTSETIRARTGELSVAVQVDVGLSIDGVLYEITGNGERLIGDLPLGGAGIRFSAAIPDIPAGLHYSLRLTATTDDPNVACSGTASFDITSRTTTVVNLKLACDELDGGASAPAIHIQAMDSGCANSACASNASYDAGVDAGLRDDLVRDAGVTIDDSGSLVDAGAAASPSAVANARAPGAAVDARVDMPVDDAGGTAVDAGSGTPAVPSDPWWHAGSHRGRDR